MKRRIGLFAAFLLCTACYSWRRADIPQPSASATPTVARPIRVGLHSGRELRLDHVRIAGDTLIGTDAKNRRVELALGDIRELRVRRFSPLRTAGAVVATGATVFFYMGLRELFGYGGPTS